MNSYCESAMVNGVTRFADGAHGYQLSIVKPYQNNPATCFRQVFSYETAMKGIGHCIHTYTGNIDPCPAFIGEPFVMPILGNADELMAFYWDLLPEAFMVGMLVKLIDLSTGEVSLTIRNASMN